MYVFDTNVFSQFFKSYYPGRFPTLWKKFDRLVASGEITSTREVFRELQGSSSDNLQQWTDDHKDVFPAPTAAEAGFVARIF